MLKDLYALFAIFYNRYPSDSCHRKYIRPCNILEAIFTQVQTCKRSLFHALVGRDTSLSLCCWMFREFVYWFYSCDIYIKHFMSTVDFDCMTNWYCVSFNAVGNLGEPLLENLSVSSSADDTILWKNFYADYYHYFCNVLLACFAFFGSMTTKICRCFLTSTPLQNQTFTYYRQCALWQNTTVYCANLLQYMLLFTIWKLGCGHFSVHADGQSNITILEM
jgi:hypothetical protein